MEYSTGGVWTTIAAGGSATINTGAIATTSLRFRKKTGDSIPVVLSVAVTHPGTIPAQIATDAAGNVSGLAGPGGAKVPLSKRKNIITQRLFGEGSPNGMTNNTQAGSTLANNTWQVKITAEADFDAVRVIYLNHMANTVVVSASVAATETAATDTTSNISDPVVGGTAYAVVDSATDAYGFRSVTWAGASSITAAAAATPTGQIPNTPAMPYVIPSISTSDWIPLRSVPRADGGTLPLCILRFYIDGAVNAFGYTADSGKYPLMRTPTAANRGRIIQMGNIGNNGVTNPAFKPSSLGTTALPFAIQFRCRRRGVTVMTVGDSITENNGLVADRLSSWGHRACADLSTADMPISHVNNGCSAMPTTTFWQHGKQMLSAIKPDIAVYSVWSPNNQPFTDAALTRYKVTNMLAQAQDFVDYCQQNGVTPILLTGIPYTSMTASTDPERKWLIAEINKMGVGGHCIVVDTNAAIGNGATPERIKATYDFGDGIHPNETAIESVIVPLVKAAIQQALMY